MKFIKTKEQQERDIKYSIYDGVLYVFMFILLTTYIPVLAIYLGGTPLQIGLFDSLPLFISSFFIFLIFTLLPKFKSEKHYIIFTTLLQGFIILLLTLYLTLFISKINIWIILLFYITFYILNNISPPVYRDWLSKILNNNRMGSFFSRRQIYMDVAGLFILLFFMYFVNIFNNKIYFFIIIFLFSGISRMISIYHINKMSEADNQKELKKQAKEYKKPIFKVFSEEIINNKNFTYFLVLIIIVFFAYYISAPYIKYLMLNVLNYSVVNYTIYIVIYTLGCALSLRYWGKIVDYYGAVKVLKASIFLLPFIILSIYFTAIHDIKLLYFMSFFNGMIFSALNISLFCYFYQCIKKNIIQHYSFFLFFYSFSVFIGSIFGAIIYNVLKNNYTQIDTLFYIFLISTLFTAISFMFFNKLEEKRKKISYKQLVKQMLIQRPILHMFGKFTHLLLYEKKTLLQKMKENKKNSEKRDKPKPF